MLRPKRPPTPPGSPFAAQLGAQLLEPVEAAPLPAWSAHPVVQGRCPPAPQVRRVGVSLLHRLVGSAVHFTVWDLETAGYGEC